MSEPIITKDYEGYALINGQRVRNNARPGNEGLLRYQEYYFTSCQFCKDGQIKVPVKVVTRYETAGNLGTLYYHIAAIKPPRYCQKCKELKCQN